MCMIISNEEGVFLLYSLRRSVCWYILGNPPCNQPPSTFIVPPMQGGAERCWGRCGRTRLGPPCHRLRVVGSWVGLGHVHIGAWPRFGVVMGYFVFLWPRYAFRFAWLRISTCILHLCPTKHIYTKTHGKCESKALILSFGFHIYLFCLNVGGKIMS